jgi:N,N-dimethylformamidase
VPPSAEPHPRGERFELTGYADPLSIRAGETVQLMTSTDAAELAIAIVRLIHGDERDAGPGFREELVVPELARHPGIRQTAHAGSHIRGPLSPELGSLASFTAAIWAFPTALQRGGSQVLVAIGSRVELRLEDGLPTARIGSDAHRVLSPAPLRERCWYLLAVAYDASAGVARLLVHPRDRDLAWPQAVAVEASVPAPPLEPAPGSRLLVGARPSPQAGVEAHFNGKVEAPCVWDRALTDTELRELAAPDAGPPGSVAGLVLHWDLAREPAGAIAWDTGGRELHGALVNLPTRAVTGRRWTGDVLVCADAPEQYAAVHLHEDDLEDAGWAPTCAWTVPDDLPSGVYAARLRADGREDHVPFVVRPHTGRPTARVALLLPTYTYLAYANERLVWGGAPDEPHGQRSDLVPDAADRYLREHPELGLSCYDRHGDGSGCCHSSRLRPIPNMRPRYRFWSSGGLERFAADLYLVDWLRHERIAFDVLTDEDLHAEGAELLAPYGVLLTGTHPEYVTGAMLDAIEAHTGDGRALMYLGGNGFYWVTSVDPARPHAIEVRRGINGTRAWTSEPGECYHASTGEPGGLWRYRGRAPNRLCGVGFSAQSDALEPAAGYVRLPASFEQRVAFIFEGVGADEVIGDFGLTNDGAAGYEIDRYDAALGSPPDAYVLATSRGRHGDSYLLAVEDMGVTDGAPGGTTNRLVGADLVYFERPGGGRVFSVGSCNWCASLSHAGYRNNVARITANVLRRFAG